MKIALTKAGVLAAVLLIISSNSNAQLSQWVTKAKSVINGGSTNTVNTATTTPQHKGYTEAYDFLPGDSILIDDNFASAAPGKTVTLFKTNGSCSVITVPDVPGKWLKLGNGGVYKLSRMLNLPAKFTVEFDVLALADEVTDLDPLIFGFAVNNSAAKYIQDPYNNGGICTMELLYFNHHDNVNVSSSATKAYFNTTFDFSSYSYHPMHVAIAADGDHVTLWMDKTKISNSELFKSNISKYFFISAPLSGKNNAAIAISNFSIRTFK